MMMRFQLHESPSGSSVPNDNPVLQLRPFKVAGSNLFFMTPFRDEPFYTEISDAVAEAVRAFGLEFLRADNPDLGGTDLWATVQRCMEASNFGVALFDAIVERDFNPNVSLELGYMMGIERHCLLLKDRHMERLPADLFGKLYKEFDSDNIRVTVLSEIADWLKQKHLAVRKQDHQQLVVFVSYGGTDRCAIAKAITNHLLVEAQFALDEIRVESRGAGNSYEPTAAATAVSVVQRRLGTDRLSSHQPRKAGPAFLFEADLILATDSEVLGKVRHAFQNYPGTESDQGLVREEIQAKSFLLTEFFGGAGAGSDIEDPYPDRGDEESRRKYEKCFDDISKVISPKFSVLKEFLERPEPPKNTLRSVSFGSRRLFGTASVMQVHSQGKSVGA
jgi:protein-tyrosine-phosphatase